ncbi:helix-turn-helix domain-containing protein [Actinoplanes sp. CA-030573]|uniref:AraC family transcriptional regulator n=1 Tax=Actinoplanes sp. CA-030573 TaxID=3239898 RepID=UPI003D8ABBF5
MQPPAGVWSDMDVAVPRPSSLPPGISMAGFRRRVPAPPVDIAMVAHPSVTLLVDLSEDDALIFDALGHQHRGSTVIGLLPGELRAGGRGLVACLQIRLSPVAAAAVLGAPAALTGAVLPLEDLWGREAARLGERLRAAGSWEDRFAIATSAIGRRFPAVEPEVAYAWRRTRGGRGRVRVESLAEEVGWSRKRLWSRFRAQLGVTPKVAARLVRFDRAAHLLAAGHAPASVAAAGGYADQSHLHREVREFTGLTPAAVAAAPWLAIDDVAWP